MTRRFGREATTYLAEPLLAGIHAGDVDRLSVRALFPAIRGGRARRTAACCARSEPSSSAISSPRPTEVLSSRCPAA